MTDVTDETQLTTAQIAAAAEVCRQLSMQDGLTGFHHGRLLGTACYLDSLVAQRRSSDDGATVVPIPPEALNERSAGQLVEHLTRLPEDRNS